MILKKLFKNYPKILKNSSIEEIIGAEVEIYNNSYNRISNATLLKLNSILLMALHVTHKLQ